LHTPIAFIGGAVNESKTTRFTHAENARLSERKKICSTESRNPSAELRARRKIASSAHEKSFFKETEHS
jgi:hypothetical protein